jgi:2-(1,2-epoxy-1,2-dihydrophenyl)acetyl-CoA isomerase
LTYESIIFERENGKAILTLNRPAALNALNVGMLVEMRDAIGSIREGSEVRVLVIKGQGKSFCSGADIVSGTGSNADNAPPDGGRLLEQHINPLMEILAALPVPIVCAVSGAAAGAGCSLALAADFVVAARSAFFLMAFSKIGLVPDAGATWILPRLVGLARATEMLMLAERIPASKAEEWGLIHAVAEDDALNDAVDALANRLATGPTVAYGLLRQALRAGLQSSYSQSLDLERNNQRIAGLTNDFREGTSAFREKRPAVFTGN